MRDLHDGQREPIPISLVAHYAFCPRRAWLESMGERTDTHQMAVGVQRHHASDEPGASRPKQTRAMDVASRALGIVGRCDAVEWDESGTATVVEHKAVPVRRRPEVTEPMVVQVALQVAALREAGETVAGGEVYFPEHHTRVPVPVGEAELKIARAHLAGTSEMLASGTAPAPLVDDPRCSRCSHAGVCLPDERALAPVRRRVLVADPDAQVLHVATPGARASIRAGRVRVSKGGEQLASVPLERVMSLVVHGNVDVSSGLIRELLWREAPTVWCSSSGRVMGWAVSARGPNGLARVRQHVVSERGHLGLAREFVAAKIGNQATLLRRHGEAPEAVGKLRELRQRALSVTAVPGLFGVEGEAAAIYFANFNSMLSDRVREQEGLRFAARTRRPARDPINAALNFSYGMLLGDCIRAVAACGLDPHAGFLHSSGRNKPALALDICEEFRAPVADSVVLGAFNNAELRAKDFSTVTGSTQLRPSGRAALIAAYERRVETKFRHPVFGYEVSWRRAMEIQARLVLGVLEGTQPSYKGVTIR